MNSERRQDSFLCMYPIGGLEEVKADFGTGSKCLFPQRSQTATDKDVH